MLIVSPQDTCNLVILEVLSKSGHSMILWMCTRVQPSGVLGKCFPACVFSLCYSPSFADHTVLYPDRLISSISVSEFSLLAAELLQFFPCISNTCVLPPIPRLHQVVLVPHIWPTLSSGYALQHMAELCRSLLSISTHLIYSWTSWT